MNNRQAAIIHELGAMPTIDPEEEIEKRTTFLADYLAQSGLNGYVLGISGGQDSLLAGILAQRAVQQLRSKNMPANFHAALLPYGEQVDRDDALLACATIQPDVVHDLDNKPTADAFVKTFTKSEGTPLRDFDKGNVKARVRMIAQYALAGTHGLLVLGTDHAAEAVTGFFTKYGDGGADVVPLAGLTKRQGTAMLKQLHVPEIFLTKPPTADLLDALPGQTDEYELGITYSQIDDYLEGKHVAATVAEHIESRFIATRHKRTQPVAFTET